MEFFGMMVLLAVAAWFAWMLVIGMCSGAGRGGQRW